jgi:hypothetical protein
MTISGGPIIATFGALVRNRRSQLGFSQEELAERADPHRTYIAAIGGRRMPRQTGDLLESGPGDVAIEYPVVFGKACCYS